MLDTGMGICNIEPLVRELWPGELTVVNCHRHFDHTGNNWRFPEVLVADEPGALTALLEAAGFESVRLHSDCPQGESGRLFITAKRKDS